MGTKLYGKPGVALRELLQNSIDACLLRQKLSELWGIEYTPKVKVSLYTKNNVDYLRVSDNGVGMNQHIIDNYYTNVGIGCGRKWAAIRDDWPAVWQSVPVRVTVTADVGRTFDLRDGIDTSG